MSDLEVEACALWELLQRCASPEAQRALLLREIARIRREKAPAEPELEYRSPPR
jgi:hypothetical protein